MWSLCVSKRHIINITTCTTNNVILIIILTLQVVKNVLMSLANHDAYYTVFNDFIRVNPELLDQYNSGLLQHTWRAILDFNNKHSWFKRRLEIL